MTEEPTSMRPANRRAGEKGNIGEYDLANGDTVRTIWLTTDSQHCHVVVWHAEGNRDPIIKPNEVRANAGRVTEEILKQMEG